MLKRLSSPGRVTNMVSMDADCSWGLEPFLDIQTGGQDNQPRVWRKNLPMLRVLYCIMIYSLEYWRAACIWRIQVTHGGAVTSMQPWVVSPTACIIPYLVVLFHVQYYIDSMWVKITLWPPIKNNLHLHMVYMCISHNFFLIVSKPIVILAHIWYTFGIRESLLP
jgi:hypothetical protein